MDFELPATTVQAASDAVSFLADRTGLPRSRIKDAMTKGAVWLQDDRGQRRLRRAKAMLKPGDVVSMCYSQAILAIDPPMPALLEDAGDWSVWIKPPGLLCGGSRFGDHCAIDRVVEKQLDRPTFLVHRLDRFVWGVMVLAHGKTAAAGLSHQFEARRTRKIYRALVHGRLQDSLVIETPIEGRTARSVVEPLESDGELTLVQVNISTGRKHQIRIHLSSAGYPVVGDRRYGSADTGGIQLAATELSFNRPDSDEPVVYQLPEDQQPVLPGQEAK